MSNEMRGSVPRRSERPTPDTQSELSPRIAPAPVSVNCVDMLVMSASKRLFSYLFPSNGSVEEPCLYIGQAPALETGFQMVAEVWVNGEVASMAPIGAGPNKGIQIPETVKQYDRIEIYLRTISSREEATPPTADVRGIYVTFLFTRV